MIKFTISNYRVLYYIRVYICTIYILIHKKIYIFPLLQTINCVFRGRGRKKEYTYT